MMRRETVGDVVNLIVAFSGALSAYFAYHSVIAANRQVKVAIEVVNRTEKLKAVSEYSAAAHATCKAFLPPDFQTLLRIEDLEIRQNVQPQDRYVIVTKTALTLAEINQKIDDNAEYFNASLRSAESKSRALSIWIDDKNDRDRLIRFQDNLHPQLRDRLKEVPWPSLEYMQKVYSLCEHRVDLRIEELSR